MTDILAGACLLLGSLLALVAGIGLVRFPDVLTRMHAATKPQSLGILLVLLITFIAQNTQRTEVRFLGWEGSAPQAVSLLIAAASGLALAVVAASLRILQLRRRVRRTR